MVDCKATVMSKPMAKDVRVQYFARCEGIKRMGPFDSDLAAWQAMRGHDGEPVKGAVV
jgi:hypothetical protein